MGNVQTRHHHQRHRHARDGRLRDGTAHPRNRCRHAYPLRLGPHLAQGREAWLRTGREQLREETLHCRRTGRAHEGCAEDDAGHAYPHRDRFLQIRLLYPGHRTRHLAQRPYRSAPNTDRHRNQTTTDSGPEQERDRPPRSHPEPLLEHGRRLLRLAQPRRLRLQAPQAFRSR